MKSVELSALNFIETEVKLSEFLKVLNMLKLIDLRDFIVTEEQELHSFDGLQALQLLDHVLGQIKPSKQRKLIQSFDELDLIVS